MASASEEPDWVLAKKGINLLINNKPKEAEELFLSHPESLTMYAGYSFAIFIDALMSFEEDKLNQATSILKEVERKCSSETGWFRSVKKAFTSNEMQQPLAQNLETQIILADSQVCLAILTFLQQEISGYFKGGWVMRKAWKVYQSSYHEILNLYKDIVGEVDQQLPAEVAIEQNIENSDLEDLAGHSSTSSEVPSTPINGYLKSSQSHHDSLSTFPLTLLKKSLSVNSALSRHSRREWSLLSLSYFTSTFQFFSPSPPYTPKSAQIDAETIKRLMGAVSFGYGLFQLGISLLPPSLLRLTNFLGFAGNRQNGIACLMYARKGVDMRAPLATLSLLWYHTIVRPFYALDGSNVQAGVNAADQLLQESELEHGESALFLFFKGRINRLNSDIPTALRAFQASVDNAAQREIKILALHEVGWCHLIQLDYCEAEGTFTYLKSWSRWSRSFYCYLAGICSGSCHNSTNFHANIKEIKNVVANGKITQLEDFLVRRAKCCPSDDEQLSALSPIFWKLLIYEMLYLWNALPSCSNENLEKIKLDCATVPEPFNSQCEPMVGLSKLILGSCFCIRKQYEAGIEHFKKCLEERKHLPNNAEDAHVSAFAQYELGSLLIRSIETKREGKIHLQNVGHYKDFDFEHRLNVRVHSMLKHL